MAVLTDILSNNKTFVRKVHEMVAELLNSGQHSGDTRSVRPIII